MTQTYSSSVFITGPYFEWESHLWYLLPSKMANKLFELNIDPNLMIEPWQPFLWFLIMADIKDSWQSGSWSKMGIKGPLPQTWTFSELFWYLVYSELTWITSNELMFVTSLETFPKFSVTNGLYTLASH